MNLNFEEIKSIIHDFLIYEIAPLKKNIFSNQFKNFLEQNADLKNAIVQFIHEIWKQNKLLQPSVHFLYILSIIKDFDKKSILPSIFQSLSIINKKSRYNQFLFSLKCSSVFLEYSDLTSNLPFSSYSVAYYLPIKEGIDLNQFYEGISNSLINFNNIKEPAFKVFKKINFPFNIYVQNILPKIERLLLRNGDKFITVASLILPRLSLPVNEKSVIVTLINSIMSKSGEIKKDLISIFKKSYLSFDQNLLLSYLYSLLDKSFGNEPRSTIATLIKLINFKFIPNELLQIHFSKILNEKLPEVQNMLILCLIDRSNESIEFLLKLPTTSSNITSIFDVFYHCSNNLDNIKQYCFNNFKLNPYFSARILLSKGFDIPSDLLSLATGSSKFNLQRFEILLRLSLHSQYLELYISNPSLFFPFLISLDLNIIIKFLDNAIDNIIFPNKHLKQFSLFIQKNYKRVINRKIISLLCPILSKESDSELLISLLPIRKDLAFISLAKIGFDQVQYNFIYNTLNNYLSNPISPEDIHLYICKDEIDFNHPSAEQYETIKNEINRPNSQTNLPQLRKKLEKLHPKIIESQVEIKSLLKQKIETINELLQLLNYHLVHSKNLSGKLSSLCSIIRSFFTIPVFNNEVFNFFLNLIKNIGSYRDSANIVYSLLFKNTEPFTLEQINFLVPKLLSEHILHLLSFRLSEILSTEFSEYFCDCNAITPNTDCKNLYPIYFEKSNLSESIYNFAVSLCEGRPKSEIEIAYDSLLISDPIIRRCSIESIAVSDLELPISSELYCQLKYQSQNSEVASILLQNLNTPPPPFEDILNIYSNLFLIQYPTEELAKNVGISFSSMMLPNSEQGLVYLIDLFIQRITSKELPTSPKEVSIRTAISYALLEYPSNSSKLVDFSINYLIRDPTPRVLENGFLILSKLVDSFDKQRQSLLFNVLFEFINQPSTSSNEDNVFKSQIIKILTKISINIIDSIPKLLECLIKNSINTNHIILREFSANSISSLCRKYPQLIKNYFSFLLEELPKLTSNDQYLGFAYSYASLLHGSTLDSFKTYNVFDFLESLYLSTEVNKKVILAHIIGALSFSFKVSIEFYYPKIIPKLITLQGESNTEIRSAADNSAKILTDRFSHACSERVLPSALSLVHNDENWRIQQAALVVIQKVFLAGARTVSKHIPSIVASLSKALKSPNSNIKNHASICLEYLRKSITNSTISDNFDILVNALLNPSKLELAIDTISHMQFNILLDAASLSLLVPIVSYGCRSNSVSIRSQAIKICGHLPSVSVQGVIDSFSDELIEPLFTGISDASPSIRAISSSSLSSISSFLSSTKFDQILEYLLKDMTQKTSFAEKQGSSMAIASLIKVRGVEELRIHITRFVQQSKDSKDVNVRECYVSLLGFLSHFFGPEDFSSCYEITIEAILDACADPSDIIRTVGLRSASLVAKTFSRTRPELILQAYFSCAQRENWRYRLCSCNFIKSFVMAVTNTTEADEKGVRQIGEILSILQIEIKPDLLLPALMTLFILSNDPVVTVNTEAQNIWRQIVPNTGQFIRETQSVLIDRIETFISSEFEVVRAVGASALSMGVKKAKTKFLIESFSLIDKVLSTDDIDIQHGGLLCIHALTESLSSEYKLRACTQLAPFLSSAHSILRNESIDAFVEMRESLGEEGSRKVSEELVKFIYERAASPNDITMLGGLLSILGHHSMVALSYDILKRPLDLDRPRIAGKIVSAAGSALEPVISSFSDRIISMCAHSPTEEESQISLLIAQEVIKTLTESHLDQFSTKLVENMRSQKPQNRHASILISKFVFLRIGGFFNETIRHLIRAALYLFDDPLDNIMNSAIDSIKYVGLSISNEYIESLVEEIADDFENLCTVSKVRSFGYPGSLDCLESLIEKAFNSTPNSILHASRILSTIVPQLSIAPASTRKFLALIVFVFQTQTDSSLYIHLLNASRSLFEKASSERQMLVNSLPVSYLRLFRESDASLHQTAVDALVSFSHKVSNPNIIIRIFLQIIKMQEYNTSSIVLKGLISIIKKNKLNIQDGNNCIDIFKVLIKSNIKGIRDLSAQGISMTLLSMPIDQLIPKLDSNEIINIENTENLYTSIIILNDLLKSSNKSYSDIVLPYLVKLLPFISEQNSGPVKLAYPKVLMSCILVDNSLIDKLLPKIIEIIDNEETEYQVIACQELQKLNLIKLNYWKNYKINLLEVLSTSFSFGSAPLRSASSSSLFNLFNLEDLSNEELLKLCIEFNNESFIDSFKEIIEQQQSDRANQRVLR